MEVPFEQTDERLLDNPIWHSLAGYHAALALGGASAKRYPNDILPFAGFPPEPEPDVIALASLMTVGETLVTRAFPLPHSSGTIHVSPADAGIQQYVYRATTVTSLSRYDISDLHEADVADMRRLIALTNPGPFLPRTILTGRYVGIHIDGTLVAMAGEQLHPGRFCEISAVCTDPACIGKGYATQLMTELIARFLERGDIPFLHVRATNHRAIKLYEKLGFVWRGSLSVHNLTYIGQEHATV